MRRTLFAVLITAIAMLSTAPAWADGPADYKAKCQMCHAANASGDTPAGKKLGAKDLRLPDAQKKTDAELLAVLQNGKNKMPAFKDKLSAQQLKDLVTVIRSMK